MREISVCKSCLKDADLKPKKFRKKLARLMGEDCQVELSSCMKLCPKKGVTYSVREFDGKKMIMSLLTFFLPEASLEATLNKLSKSL